MENWIWSLPWSLKASLYWNWVDDHLITFFVVSLFNHFSFLHLILSLNLRDASQSLMIIIIICTLRPFQVTLIIRILLRVFPTFPSISSPKSVISYFEASVHLLLPKWYHLSHCINNKHPHPINPSLPPNIQHPSSSSFLSLSPSLFTPSSIFKLIYLDHVSPLCWTHSFFLFSW